MASVSLLRLPTTVRERWAFVFEHDQAHRKRGNTLLSYVLDPMQGENRPGSKWHLDHQQAHNRMAVGPPPADSQILRDSNLSSPKQRTWWEFVNHHEHFIHP